MKALNFYSATLAKWVLSRPVHGLVLILSSLKNCIEKNYCAFSPTKFNYSTLKNRGSEQPITKVPDKQR